MDAVVELAAFAEEHMGSLDDIPAAVQQIVAHRVPHATEKQHAEAIDLVIRAIEHLEEESEGGNESPGETTDSVRKPSPWDTIAEDIERVVPGTVAFPQYILAYMTARFRPTRKSVMYSSLLTTAVGNFEVLVSAIVREFLRLKPEAIRSDESKYSLAEIEGYESLDEFRAYCAERYAENLLRGSFEDWMEWFARRLKVSLEDITADPVGPSRGFPAASLARSQRRNSQSAVRE